MPAEITKKRPEKRLLKALKKHGGRNSTGRITVRHKGGGSRKQYRMVDFGQQHMDVPGIVTGIEYDPNRNAYIALVAYEDGTQGYIIAPHDIEVGSRLLCAEQTDVVPGNRMRLKHMPIGTLVHNLELEPGRGGKIVRSAGTSATVTAQEGKYTFIRMPSGEIRKMFGEGFASVGSVSNPEFRYKNVGKAGSARNKGKRPVVRGSAMNPVDHPHGGGEGRTGIGLKHPKTPWGKPALGVKTRKKKWTDTLIVKRRKKKKKK